MVQESRKLTQTDAEVEVLKSVVSKLDTSLEKISEVSNQIGKLLAVHNERLNQLERDKEATEQDVKEVHSRITTNNREIMEKLQQMEDRIEERMKQSQISATAQHNDIKVEIQEEIKGIETRIDTLEKWKWLVLGGAAALGWLLSNYKAILTVISATH